MTTKSRIAGPLLTLSAALIAIPLMAEEPMIVEGKPVYQERVSTADLDLREWGAQLTLKRRVHHASERVCLQAEGRFALSGVPGFGPEYSRLTCADLTYADARPQITAAIQRAKAGEKVAMALVIATPVRAR